MVRQRFQWTNAALIGAILFAMAVGYICTYFALVMPTDPGIKTLGRSYTRYAAYRWIDSEEARAFFAPINCVDRWIRRDTWTTR